MKITIEVADLQYLKECRDALVSAHERGVVATNETVWGVVNAVDNILDSERSQ
jgi:hypothetical protein